MWTAGEGLKDSASWMGIANQMQIKHIQSRRQGTEQLDYSPEKSEILVYSTTVSDTWQTGYT